MSQQLRQRVNASVDISSGKSNMSSSEDRNDMDFHVRTGLDAPRMLKANPQHYGVVLKLHVPLLYSFLPEVFQKCVLSWKRLSFLAPHWEQRYLILLGSFLYKFKNEKSLNPKGTPFAMETIEVDAFQTTSPRIHSDADFPFSALSILPPEFGAIFTVRTFSKRHYYAVVSQEEATTWVNSLRQARQETITRNMGHAENMPYPKSWNYFDNAGRSFKKRKERIKAKLEDQNFRELEMTSFNAGTQMIS